jgi:hypothetical protein
MEAQVQRLIDVEGMAEDSIAGTGLIVERIKEG